MDQLATTCELADLFSIRLGNPNNPPTYQRGPRRIDYVLITPSLLDHVTAAGYDPFGYRIPSDHRGMYIDFDTTSLFSQEITKMASVERRGFKSTDPGIVKQYVQAKMTYLAEHRFFNRLHTLNNLTKPDHTLAESLDRDLQRASYHAARICTKREKPPWSPQLAEAWAELHFFSTRKNDSPP